MRSAAEESRGTTRSLREARQDHRRWIAELEASVRSPVRSSSRWTPTPVPSASGTHSFVPPNVVMETHMKRFDKPHQAIHEMGADVAALVARGETEQAMETIRHGRDTILSSLIQLFDETPRVLAETNREMVIVLKGTSRMLGVTADAVESVEAIKPETLEPIGGLGPEHPDALVTRTVRTAKADRLVLVADVDRLLSRFAHVRPSPHSTPPPDRAGAWRILGGQRARSHSGPRTESILIPARHADPRFGRALHKPRRRWYASHVGLRARCHARGRSRGGRPSPLTNPARLSRRSGRAIRPAGGRPGRPRRARKA